MECYSQQTCALFVDGELVADESRQPLARAAARKETVRHFGQGENGVLGADRDVALEHHLVSAGHAIALDRGNHRLAHVRDDARRPGREVMTVVHHFLRRPRRTLRDQRGARENALQPHRRREAPRHNVPRHALPDGAARDQVSPEHGFAWPFRVDAAGRVAEAAWVPSPTVWAETTDQF